MLCARKTCRGVSTECNTLNTRKSDLSATGLQVGLKAAKLGDARGLNMACKATYGLLGQHTYELGSSQPRVCLPDQQQERKTA